MGLFPSFLSFWEARMGPFPLFSSPSGRLEWAFPPSFLSFWEARMALFLLFSSPSGRLEWAFLLPF